MSLLGIKIFSGYLKNDQTNSNNIFNKKFRTSSKFKDYSSFTISVATMLNFTTLDHKCVNIGISKANSLLFYSSIFYEIINKITKKNNNS